MPVLYSVDYDASTYEESYKEYAVSESAAELEDYKQYLPKGVAYYIS